MFTPKREYSYPFSDFILPEHTLSTFRLFVHDRLFICLIHPLSPLCICSDTLVAPSQMMFNECTQIFLPGVIFTWCHLLVAKILLVNRSVHDPVLCSIKFNLIFITSVLKVIQFFRYSISVFLCIDEVSNFVRSTNLFKTLLHFAPSLLIEVLSKTNA